MRTPEYKAAKVVIVAAVEEELRECEAELVKHRTEMLEAEQRALKSERKRTALKQKLEVVNGL